MPPFQFVFFGKITDCLQIDKNLSLRMYFWLCVFIILHLLSSMAIHTSLFFNPQCSLQLEWFYCNWLKASLSEWGWSSIFSVSVLSLETRLFKAGYGKCCIPGLKMWLKSEKLWEVCTEDIRRKCVQEVRSCEKLIHKTLGENVSKKWEVVSS